MRIRDRRVGARAKGDAMLKIKLVFAAALLTAPAMWMVASISSNPVTEQASVAVANQVDTFQLMSTSRRMPTQSYDSY